MLNVAVLVSGGGTNLQALLDSEARGENPNGKITLVVASKPGVFALERAAKAGVEGCVVRRKDYAASEEFDAALLETLRAHKIDLVVLAGFLSVLGPSVIAAYPRRILNVHPALIPSFCGPGMYGLRPHEAALARGCKVTGATVHFVNEARRHPRGAAEAGDGAGGMEAAAQGCGYGVQRRDLLKACRALFLPLPLGEVARRKL